ncbi:hypothetical protein EVAR_25628_1 [Eumeta japonica]|uniref:Uncharacterized protein n=1 Tax=Eumeta variegata TaxID=151549 RepID=A0A4C1V0U2_EUMVA|nr:hypothetical protein EVAR_25628_1 [Eumeta japonica]
MYSSTSRDCELNANALSNEHDFDLLPRPWPSPSPYRRNRRREVISRQNLYTRVSIARPRWDYWRERRPDSGDTIPAPRTP